MNYANLKYFGQQCKSKIIWKAVSGAIDNIIIVNKEVRIGKSVFKKFPYCRGYLAGQRGCHNSSFIEGVNKVNR